MINKIHNMDCMQCMAMMPDKSIDYCITSPPYNMQHGSISNGKKTEFTKYENFQDDFSVDEYYIQQKEMISELLRVTNNHIFYNIQMITGNKFALHRLMGDFYKNIKEVFIWNKGFGSPAISENVFNSAFEYIIVFSNNHPEKRYFHDANFKRGTQSNIFTLFNKHSNKYADIHKAVFPLDMPRYFMQNFGKENDIWFDPYMGTGTTGLGAVMEKRRYIGSDISEKYCELARKRIEVESNQVSMF
tara:strand:+ start:323 stop:1057 length:735 start_codon:yes stop_codon:yes gene_type:complete